MITGSKICRPKNTHPSLGFRCNAATPEEGGPNRWWALAVYDQEKDAQGLDEISRFFVGLGVLAQNLEDFGRAARAFKRAFQTAPCAPIAYAWARSALAAGLYEQAREAIGELEVADPMTHPVPSDEHMRGDLKSASKRTGTSILEEDMAPWMRNSNAAKKLIEDRGKLSSAYQSLGQYAEQTEEFDLAAEIYLDAYKQLAIRGGSPRGAAQPA